MAAAQEKRQGEYRPAATCGTLIPIQKSARWWNLAQDERRAILEETSHHTAIGLDYLPASSGGFPRWGAIAKVL